MKVHSDWFLTLFSSMFFFFCRSSCRDCCNNTWMDHFASQPTIIVVWSISDTNPCMSSAKTGCGLLLCILSVRRSSPKWVLSQNKLQYVPDLALIVKSLACETVPTSDCFTRHNITIKQFTSSLLTFSSKFTSGSPALPQRGKQLAAKTVKRFEHSSSSSKWALVSVPAALSALNNWKRLRHNSSNAVCEGLREQHE